MRKSVKPLSFVQPSGEELKSFGVFLGSFHSSPTPGQARLLSQWDVVVLNPFESGVLEALHASRSTSKHILGRVDVASLLGSEGKVDSDAIVQSLRTFEDTITKYFSKGGEKESPFTDILLANFVHHFSAPVLNELAGYINDRGLGVWLEMGPPDYLSEEQCRAINVKSIAGIVYRNGTIRPDGDRQNYHQMTAMRTAMRAVAAQRAAHGPPLMMWETIDDGVEYEYAVIVRSFNWCRYNSALCWIGSASALTDEEAAATQTVSEKPLGALMWLKDAKNMKAHNIWRANGSVSAHELVLLVLT